MPCALFPSFQMPVGPRYGARQSQQNSNIHCRPAQLTVRTIVFCRTGLNEKTYTSCGRIRCSSELVPGIRGTRLRSAELQLDLLLLARVWPDHWTLSPRAAYARHTLNTSRSHEKARCELCRRGIGKLHM